ncbi:MAG: glycosyl hydrolase, partial [Gammaproteobacteria bacterium]|nr:glycosyl hydrolase [Gammaproteobacteria bacterium]
LGTEFGVFFTVNGGGEWTKLKGGVPNIPFRDLVIQTRENDLVGATFGRSFYILDDYSPLRSVNAGMLKNDTVLFPVRRTHWYVPKRPLGCGEPGCSGSQGDSYFVAPNPDFGAIFTYYLPETIRTARDARREKEKERETANQDVEFASWDTILKEQREDAPAIVFTVRNANGSVVRQIDAPVEAGFHRVSWNLRYPAVEAWVPEDEREHWRGEGLGALVVPGTFSVSMHKRVDGVLSDLGQSQTFEVVSIREPTLPGSTQEQRVVFETQIDELLRASDGTVKAIDEIMVELDAVKEVLQQFRADASLYEIANSIKQRITIQRERLRGNETRQNFKDLDEVPLSERIHHARFVSATNAYGPTPEQRESLQIGRALYDDVKQQLTELIDVEYAGLKDAMDTARVPWTPGRGVQ